MSAPKSKETIFEVWRLDDNGREYLMYRFRDEKEAESFRAEFESRGHKQIYWMKKAEGNVAGIESDSRQAHFQRSGTSS
ncbi:hypothetical protein SCOR_25920 [Sulfidibacter corallicola]